MKKIGEYVISVIRVIITALLWAAALVYLYFFLFKDYAIRKSTLFLLLFLTVVSLFIVLLISGWRAYNVRRFSKLNRRKFASPVTSEEVGRTFGLNSVSVESLQASRSLTLAVTRQYDGDRDGKVGREVITISGGGAKYRLSRPAVPEASSAFTRTEGSAGNPIAVNGGLRQTDMNTKDKDDCLRYIDEALERVLSGQFNGAAVIGNEDTVFSSIVGKLQQFARDMGKIHNLIESLDCGELPEGMSSLSGDSQYLQWNSMLSLIEKRVQELAGLLEIDGMTGMLNRQSGLRVIERRLGESLLSGEGHCLAFIDVDRLKRINDSFGHAAGDALIECVARVILSSIRRSDVAVRYGGDEFVVFFGNCGRKMAARRLREMCSTLNKVNRSKLLPYRMSFSYGIASNRSDGTTDLWDLINLADRRMYVNKQRRVKPEPLLGSERRLKFKVCARLK